MKRSLIMSIALVSLIAMGSPAMADRGVHSVFGPGNSAAGNGGKDFPLPDTQPNCLGQILSFLGMTRGVAPVDTDALLEAISLVFTGGAAIGGLPAETCLDFE